LGFLAVITLKSSREIALMREAGKIVAEAHRIACGMIAPGVTTREIDREIEALFEREKAESLFKGFPGKVPFPAVTCTSVNEQIVHGIPGGYQLKPGDIISIDTGCRLNGWCGDSAWTYAVGEISAEKQKLMACGEEALREAIRGVATEKRWSAVARRLERLIHGQGFGIVEEFVGHGIGRKMHEPPQIPNFLSTTVAKDDFEIRPGLVLAIEPMINAGTKAVKVLKDHWTAVTADGKPSVHFEHTVAVTNDGPVLITEGVGGDFRW
jgi:methionyl aminopeptidase